MNIVTRDTLPLLSFIIGLGFTIMIFQKPYHDKRILALPVDEIHGKSIRVDGKCYKYVAEDTQCEILSSK
jgi:hypothetical protein